MFLVSAFSEYNFYKTWLFKIFNLFNLRNLCPIFGRAPRFLLWGYFKTLSMRIFKNDRSTGNTWAGRAI